MDLIQLPFSFTVSKSSDFLLLEKKIRKILDCQSSSCTFFNSTDYKKLKFRIQNKLQGNVMELESQRVFYIPKTPFVICLMDNNQTVVILDTLHEICDTSDLKSEQLDTSKRKNVEECGVSELLDDPKHKKMKMDDMSKTSMNVFQDKALMHDKKFDFFQAKILTQKSFLNNS